MGSHFLCHHRPSHWRGSCQDTRASLPALSLLCGLRLLWLRYGGMRWLRALLLVWVSLNMDQHLGRSWQLAWCLEHNRCFRIDGQKNELEREGQWLNSEQTDTDKCMLLSRRCNEEPFWTTAEKLILPILTIKHLLKKKISLPRAGQRAPVSVNTTPLGRQSNTVLPKFWRPSWFDCEKERHIKRNHKGRKWGGKGKNNRSEILSQKIHLSWDVPPVKSVRISVRDSLLHHLADVKPK